MKDHLAKGVMVLAPPPRFTCARGHDVKVLTYRTADGVVRFAACVECIALAFPVFEVKKER